MKFEWDTDKEKSNKQKHGVAFTEACSVFADTAALTIFDPDHSEDEERWITVGRALNGAVIAVVHTYRNIKNNESVRIISARKAAKNELMTYLKGGSKK